MKVLIVEDDEDTSEVLAEYLSGEGHAVLRASTGDEAVALLVTLPSPYAVLLDLGLPGMNGLEVLAYAERARSGSQDRVIAITADSILLKQLRATGFPRVLNKPFGLIEVKQALAALDKTKERSPMAHPAPAAFTISLTTAAWDGLAGLSPLDRDAVRAAIDEVGNSSFAAEARLVSGRRVLEGTGWRTEVVVDGAALCVTVLSVTRF